MSQLVPLLEQALTNREALFEILASEHTNAYRLFHGTVEGWEGLNIDRYGPLLLLQTFRAPLEQEALEVIDTFYQKHFGESFHLVYNHRGKQAIEDFEQWHQPTEEAMGPHLCKEFGLDYQILGRHRGIDPHLFLDMRCGRRYLRGSVQGLTMLNLFSYTCSVGIAAAAAGAKTVWNVDFASSNLEVGLDNSRRNGIGKKRFRCIQEDVFPVIRQFAGLPMKGRGRLKGRRGQKSPKFQKFEPREFDVVFLDPPRWAKSRFGAVDIVRDYQSLFKPALLCAKAGGRIIAVNNVAQVDLDEWLEQLQRCAEKAGRPIQDIQVLPPDPDFPSFDQQPPLKVAVCYL